MQTASDHINDIRKLEKTRERERREFKNGQALLEAYEDLRDDVMSAVKNSGLSFQDIHGRCGPHPSTLESWASKTVRQPRLGKLRSTLRILGLDFGIVSGGKNEDYQN